MPRSLSKKPIKRQKKSATPVGRILEMKPVAVPHARRGGPGLLILTLIAVGSIATAALAFQKMAVVFDYVEAADRELVAANAKASDLKTRITDLETLQALSKKTAVPSVPDDLIWLDYSSSNLSLKYPQGYSVVKATSAFPALSIKSDKGGIIIFRTKDVSPSLLPYGILDKSMIGTAFNSDRFSVAKQTVSSANDQKIIPYDVWAYYSPGDEETAAVLNKSVASIKVVK